MAYTYKVSDVYTFNYTGAEQSFPVPAGVTLKLECWGARGGSVGGAGGYAKGEFKTDVDCMFYIYVGGAPNSIIGGWNGGGNAGTGTGYGISYGGGGGSDIRLNSNSINNRIIVGGGGGGMAASGNNGALGGVGGGLNGGNGGLWCCGDNGDGGTQTAGGAGGIVRVNATGPGQAGAFWKGGNGHSAPSYQGGGGGGGGWYGGGGASDGCGGGAGGGGSSYYGSLLNPVTTAGVNTGHGIVKITVLKADGIYFLQHGIKIYDLSTAANATKLEDITVIKTLAEGQKAFDVLTKDDITNSGTFFSANIKKCRDLLPPESKYKVIKFKAV